MTQISLEAPPEEKREQLQIQAARGICSSCRHHPTCTYPRDSGQVVLQCEEFEGYVMTIPEMACRSELPSNGSRGGSSAKDKPSSQHMGLCTNCANRETCTYPKAEGGVWHCDEYL
jgi:hypothetical protein